MICREKKRGCAKTHSLNSFDEQKSLVFLQRFCNLSGEELSVQASDISDRDTFRAFCFAGEGVRAVTEAEFVHSCHHLLYSVAGFDLTLREESELRDLGRDEEHGATVLTCCDTSAAADTLGGIH